MGRDRFTDGFSCSHCPYQFVEAGSWISFIQPAPEIQARSYIVFSPKNPIKPSRAMFSYSSTVFALLMQHVAAQQSPYGASDFLRFGCSQLVVERVDPLVTPGLNPSPHTHQIVGGNSFNVTMDPYTIDPPAQSSCTSCIYKEDTSNYWTASIYFRSPENGTYRKVPQMANGRLNGTLLEQDGGLTIYYMRPFGGTNKNTTAMKPVSSIGLTYNQPLLTMS
jgi:hypothetical protein